MRAPKSSPHSILLTASPACEGMRRTRAAWGALGLPSEREAPTEIILYQAFNGAPVPRYQLAAAASSWQGTWKDTT